MHIIIWEYRVRPERESDFMQGYSHKGAWARLFGNGEGYLGTELLQDERNKHHFVTIDRWISSEAFNAFKSNWQAEYDALDARCEGMTENETLIGGFDSLA